jgi:hypothetical protein
MLCKDPATTYLKQFGYNVIRLPKADFNPLTLLVREKQTMAELGNLSTVIQPDGVSIPNIKKDNPVTHIAGKKTANLSAGIALDILGKVITAMGGSKLGLDLKYKNARTIQFTFSNALEDSIQITELDKFLAKSDIVGNPGHVARLMEADDVYIVTAVLKSNEITVDASGSSDLGTNVSIPEIQNAIGGNVEVSKSTTSEASLNFKGNVPLAFGFKAIRLFYEDGKYRRFEPAKHTVPLSMSAEVSGGSELYFSEKGYVDFE